MNYLNQNIMKTKTTLFIFLFVFVGMITQAQQAPIMVCDESGLNCTPYYNGDLETAYQEANAGDYIYLPGGVFTLSSSMDKKIHMVGAGISITDASVTGISKITNEINFYSGSNGSSFEGIEFTTVIARAPIDSILFKRCLFNRINTVTNENGFLNSTILQCVVQGDIKLSALPIFSENLNGVGINNIIQNSIITGAISSIYNSYVNNCVVGRATTNSFYSVSNTIVRNSITYHNFNGGSDNSFLYSIMYIANPNQGLNHEGSYFNISPEQLFQDASLTSFSWDSNYSIIPGSTAHQSGDDGTDMGIYGGSTPWVEHGRPGNPHFNAMNVGVPNEQTQQLPVQIQVSQGQ